MEQWPPKYFTDRDEAIKASARNGGSWLKQALAGLGAMPPGTRGMGEHFAYMLTCARSPLGEPTKPNAWGMVFRAALAGGLIERGDGIARTKQGGIAYIYERTARWRALPVPYTPAAHRSRSCQHCDKSFDPTAPGSRYCSTKCATEARLTARRDRAKQVSSERKAARRRSPV